MKTDKKKYTYEDWLNDPDGIGSPLNLTDNPHVTLRITNSRRQALKWAIQSRIRQEKFTARFKIEKGRVNDPFNWLRLQIQKIESFINDNPDLELQWEQGFGYLTKVLLKINGAFYKQAKELNERSKKGQYYSPWHGMDWDEPPIVAMYIYKECLPFLKDLKDNLDILLYSEENNPPNPFDILVNDTAIKCIQLFIEEGNVSKQNEDTAKSWLAAAEIMAKDGGKGDILKSRTGAAREIAKQPYFKDIKLPNERTTGNRWLKTYLDDYRGEEFFGT